MCSLLVNRSFIQICDTFMSFCLSIGESVMLGSREKLSKIFLQEATALVSSSFEVVFVKMYVMICIKNSDYVKIGKKYLKKEFFVSNDLFFFISFHFRPLIKPK